MQIGGLCYLLLDNIGHQTPAAAEPLRLAAVREHNRRAPFTCGMHLRELLGRLAELTDAWEYDGSYHHYTDDDDRPYPAEMLFPEMLARPAGGVK